MFFCPELNRVKGGKPGSQICSPFTLSHIQSVSRYINRSKANDSLV
jgi:hypothetical protein